MLPAGFIAMWWFRRSRWATIWWFPVFSLNAIALAAAIMTDDGMRHGPGGGGGEGIIFSMVWGSRLVLVLLLIACLICFPRRHSWHARVALPVILGWLLIGTAGYAAYHLSQRLEVCLLITDSMGTPIPGVVVNYRIMGPAAPMQNSVTDAQGRAVIAGTKTDRLNFDVSYRTNFSGQSITISRTVDGSFEVNREWNVSVPGHRATEANERRGSGPEQIRQIYEDSVPDGRSIVVLVELASKSADMPFAYDQCIAKAVRRRLDGGHLDRTGRESTFYNLAGLYYAADLAKAPAFGASLQDQQALLEAALQAKELTRWVCGPQSAIDIAAQRFLDRLHAAHRSPLTPAELNDIAKFLSDVAAQVEQTRHP